MIMKVYIIWLTAVIAWNFMVPRATPLEDVVVAVLLSLMSMFLKKNFKSFRICWTDENVFCQTLNSFILLQS